MNRVIRHQTVYHMNNQKMIPNDLLDIIFMDRNKSYGAYDLRKTYHRRLKRSFVLAMTFIGVAFAIPALASLFSTPPIVRPLPLHPHVFPPIPSETIICPPRKKIKSGSTKGVRPPEIVKAIEAPEKKDTIPHTPDVSDQQGPSNLPGPFVPGGEDGGAPTSAEFPPTSSAPPEPVIPEVPVDAELVEEGAEFPGGEAALADYIHKNLHFTKSALDEGLTGKVVIGFVVNKNGELIEPQILRSIGFGMDEEVIKVIKNMPAWKSAKNHGKAVMVKYALPIMLETTDR